MKKNILLILLILSIFTFLNIEIYRFYGETVKLRSDSIPDINRMCSRGEILYEEACKNNKYIIDTYDRYVPDVITSFYHIVGLGLLAPLDFIFPLLLMFICIYNLSKENKSVFIKMRLQRQTFKSYIKDIFKKSYKYALILPLLLLYVFIVCLLISRHFNYQLSADLGYELLNIGYPKNMLIYVIVFFVNLGIHCSIYVSYALIYVKKLSNSIVSALASYITFIAVEVFIELILCSLILDDVFHVNAYLYLNYLNMFDLSDANLYICLFKTSLYALIIFFIVKRMYRDKDKYINDLEKSK